jgi:hypothetical protein
MALTEKYVSSLAAGGGNGDTEGTAYTFTEMITQIKSATGTGGQNKRYNIKADGTYNRTLDDDFGGSGFGTTSAPVHLRGYKTTIGDGYQGRTADNGLLVNTNMPLISYAASKAFLIGKYTMVESLRVEGANGGNALLNCQDRTSVFGCSVVNAGTGGSTIAVILREGDVTFESDYLVTTASGPTNYVLRMEGQCIKVDSFKIISSAAACGGIGCFDRWPTIYGNLIKGNGGAFGINSDQSDRVAYVRNNTITGFTDAIRWSAVTDWPSFICGNMITDNAGYALNMLNVGDMILIGPNRTRDNALGVAGGAAAQWADTGRLVPLVTTDTGGPETDYANAASNDYNLIAASPARNQNVPRFTDLGAYDNKDAAGGGGGTAVFNPLAQTIIRPA